MDSINSQKKKLKQIVIDEKNYRYLKSLGNAGESFNDVITGLLKNYTADLYPKNNHFTNQVVE
ncbi:MAG: antitoxin VapB family protein [Candidatus Nitrosocosmicus sp.]|nr:antitoxin VapB family protein [Candidatus Nitrosocosmicus sp.]